MSKLVIVHFSPIELYPPVQNLISVLERAKCKHRIFIITTQGIYKELDNFKQSAANIRIIRLGKSGQNIKGMQRYLSYFLFYVGSFFYLLGLNPKRILYYETLSAFPVWLYRKFFNKRVQVLIHYHEYTTPMAYQNGMRLTRQFYRLEKWLYPRVQWLSHTNRYRMDLFEKDISPIKTANTQIIPNYPPKTWFAGAPGKAATPIKVVYIGSLSMDTMYTHEFAKWVIAQNNKVSWHIYSYNITDAAKIFLQSFQTDSIVLKGGVNYEELPEVMKQYDVGVILYNGHIPNYVYNAPNKLFEYLACGLDVWYPEVMVGIRGYNTDKTYPKVIPLNFSHLDKFDAASALDKHGYTLRNPTYFCEDSFSLLVRSLCEQEN